MGVTDLGLGDTSGYEDGNEVVEEKEGFIEMLSNLKINSIIQ